jgi:hypothetical protein
MCVLKSIILHTLSHRIFNLSVFSALNFAFDYGGKNAPLPTALINQTVTALSLLLRMQCCSSEMKQKTVEYLVNVTVSALLDERMHIDQNIMRATNKVWCFFIVSDSSICIKLLTLLHSL